MSLLIPFALEADPWVIYDAGKPHDSTEISPTETLKHSWYN